MVNNLKLFWDLGFRQVRINGDPGVESLLQVLDRELVVKRDDLLDQWSRSHLVDEGLVVTLAGLHMRDAIRHVHGCQFPDNSSLNAAHEPVLSSKNQVQVLSRKLSTMPLSEVRVHGLKVQVQLLIKFRRNMAMMCLEEFVIISTEQPGHPL